MGRLSDFDDDTENIEITGQRRDPSYLIGSTVFFGSGPVAAKSLELLAKNCKIEAVVTKPKPAHHHGNFPVLDTAESLHLPIHTVSNKLELSKLIATKPFQSELGVLIDFGIIVAKDTIDYFPKGIVNSHFSLLPELRGADPITFAILSGLKQTGVSLMLLVEKMDEGAILTQGLMPINKDDTSTSLTKRLISLSDDLLTYDLPDYVNGTIQPKAQLGDSTYSRKLTKEDGRIDWSKPANQLEREIRAYSEWPKSYTTLAGKVVIITKAHVAQTKDNNPLAIETNAGFLVIDTLKPAGKNEMTTKEFLAGYGKDL